MTTQVYSSHQQTRQQLDELDALLQRMLTLPMNPAEPAGPAYDAVRSEQFTALPPTLPQATPLPQAPAGSVVHAWRLSTPTMPAEPPMATPVDDIPSAFVPPPAPYPYSMVYGQPLPAQSAPIPPVVVPTIPAPQPAAMPAAATPAWAIPVPASTGEAPGLFSIPFVVINQLFDALTYLLGPLGTWLRSPSGGRVMGALGVLMILGAIAWAGLDLFGKGWTP